MSGIKRTVFLNQSLQSLGIELTDFAALKPKLPAQPERLEFYMLLLVKRGEGAHRIDFIDYSLRKSDLMLVRPGQVQEWLDYQDLDADVILFDPLSLPHDEGQSGQLSQQLSLAYWANVSCLTEQVEEDISASFYRLKKDINGFDQSPMDIALVQHEMLGLLLRLARWFQKNQTSSQLNPRSRKTYYLFSQLLEQAYKQQHNLSFYAKRLGYAESTISRACKQAQGESAKKVIDQRIVLEAKRMLVHSPLSITEIGYSLGFSEATNFNKFFRRLVGDSPKVFREGYHQVQ